MFVVRAASTHDGLPRTFQTASPVVPRQMIDLEEEAEHFLIFCHGIRMIQVKLDHRLVLPCENGDGQGLTVVLEEGFTPRSADREMIIRPGERDGGAGLAASELFDEEVSR